MSPACPTCNNYYSFYAIFLIVAVETINGTGLSGVDFEAKDESITLSSLENTTLEINTREADEICELGEKQFQMAIYDQSGTSVSSTLNITINPDTQCGKPFFSVLIKQ